MIKWNRIDADGDYLIIAPKPKPGYGYYHTITERAFLVHNLQAFICQHADIGVENIMIYELCSVNNFQDREKAK